MEILNNRDLTGRDFSNIDLTGLAISHSTITDCKFGNCSGANFACTKGSGCDFTQADISHTTFQKADEAVIQCLIGATWAGVKITAVSGWLSRNGYYSFACNAFVQIGCMQKTLAEWEELGTSLETLSKLHEEQPAIDLEMTWNWWQKNTPKIHDWYSKIAVDSSS